MKDELFILKI